MSFLLGITESFQRLWRRTPTRNWLIAFISCCVIGFVAGFVWAKVAEAAPAPQKAPVNYAPATDLRPGADFGPYANITRAREAFQWPVLDVNLAIKRSRVHTYTRCRKMIRPAGGRISQGRVVGLDGALVFRYVKAFHALSSGMPRNYTEISHHDRCS